MKKILLTLTVAFFALFANAQYPLLYTSTIGLDHVYKSTGEVAYVDQELIGQTLVFKTYNFQTFALEETRNIDLSSYINDVQNNDVWVYVGRITDKLFDTDDALEFIVTIHETNFNTNYRQDHSIIYDDNNTVIMDVSNYVASFDIMDSEGLTVLRKADLDSNYNGPYTYYELPGHFPCEYCDGLTLNNNSPENNQKNSSFKLYPNPNSTYANITYALPNNEKFGYVQIFSATGTKIKEYKVDASLGKLRLSNNQLAPGNYYYILTDSKGRVLDTEKSIVIK